MKTLFNILTCVLKIASPILFVLVLLWFGVRFGPLPEGAPVSTLELSIGGEVKTFKTSAKNTIHVITDDDLKITDIQVLTPETLSRNPSHKPTYGQQTSEIVQSSSQESKARP